MADETALTQTSEATTETLTNDVVDTTALGGADESTKTAETPDAPVEEAAADKPVEAVVPDAYDLTAPEGTTLDAKSIELATPVFKELGLTNEAANKLMPVAAAFAKTIQDQTNQQIISQVQADRKAWLDTAKADPEMGGAKWNETIATAAGALDRLGLTKGTEFRNLLDESGLGNHPEMIRAFRKVGLAIGEDSTFARGETGAKKSIEEKFYGSGN